MIIVVITTHCHTYETKIAKLHTVEPLGWSTTPVDATIVLSI